MRSRAVLVALLALLTLVNAPTRQGVQAAGGSTLDRPADPVVLTGADVPSLQGVAPGDIVAFSYSGGWQQVPVQVDERFVQNFKTIYNNVPPPTSSTNITVLVYADPNTFTGADPDPNLDGDDEIAFMAKDAGGTPPPFSEPAHVVHGSGVELTISDPLQPSQTGVVFLFKQDGTLSPGAGLSYVTYNFNLLSGPYLTTYHLADGPNAENSTVTTPYYARHFGDRWLDDELHVTAGAASGADILDRHKALFAPGNCARSEDTFDNGDSVGFPGEGAFVVNKSGPVRAIRSWVGANSGPNTQREEVLYAQREDIRTYLRVHQINSIMDFFDYSPAAAGMTYYNDLNLGGVTIDGVPEAPALGPIHWEMVTGAQGSLVIAGAISTNIPGFGYTSYYLDSTTPVTQCTGDAFAYGSSGVYVNQSVPCTDPGLSCTTYLNTVRTMYYGPPGETVADAQALSAQAMAPLTFTASAWTAAVGGIAQEPAVGALPPQPGAGGRPLLAVVTITLLAIAIGTGAWLALRQRPHRSARNRD